MTPHYKMIEIGGKELAVFYPQFKDDDGYKIIDKDNRFPIELRNHDEYMSFLETLIEREQELKDGLTTLADLVDEMDMLARGPKGDTRYMWVKYADDAEGNGMSDNPDGKKYIGMAFNKDTETPSNNASDYKWVKYAADYEGLEIGGRNYLPNSKAERQLTSYTLFLPLDEENKHELAGEQVVVSFEARHDNDSSPVTPHVYYRASDGYNMGHSYGENKRTTTEYQRFVIPIDEDKIPSDMTNYTGLIIRKNDNSNTIYIRNIKLEKGTIATDWTPAPEDIFDRIDNVDKAHVGLSNVQNYGIASQSQAENGTSNNAYMTPLRTKQAIEKLSSSYVIDTEIGDDYILKKYSDGTFELKGHVKKTESLTSEINNMYRTGNLRDELTPIIDDSYKLIYSNAWVMDGYTNSFLVMSSVSNPLNEKSIRYRIMGNNISPTEDVEFTIGYEAYGTWS